MGFIKTPFIPEGDVKLAVIDYRLPMAMEDKLNSLGVECIRTVRCKELYDSVNGHPDMLLQHMGGNRIILAPNIYDEMAPILSKKGFAVTKGATWLVRNYPGNIAYNILRMGNKAFHSFQYTDSTILEALKKEETIMVDVKQGYTKCSVCILDDRTIITSDLKLSRATAENGIDSLLIKPGGIVLKGLNYGFIGGACGLLAKKKLAFTGSPVNLDDYMGLIKFLDNKGFELVTLSEGEMEDFGSIIPLKCD